MSTTDLDLMEEHCGISHAQLTVVARGVLELLAARSPLIVRRRGHRRLLGAALPQARGLALRELGVRTLTAEQSHVIEVLTDSHVTTWEARARRALGLH